MTGTLVGFRSLACSALLIGTVSAHTDADVYLTGVPDYGWYYGCFGTACGNLMGYWDLHGFPDFYTGPTRGGVAPPLYNSGWRDEGIGSMWASQAGFDGRPAGVFGHVDDYYDTFESTATDPYIGSNRTEHVSDCIGDFIGLNQKRWTNMNNECDGNIDGYAFVFWDTNGMKRVNFVPPPQGSNVVKDIPSGLRAWTQYRGYETDVFSQLVSFNPECTPGQGFTFEQLKAEIDAGYPVLAFLQNYNANSRTLSGMPKANPETHAMLIYGYQINEAYGTTVYVRDGWGGGEQTRFWPAVSWLGSTLPLRGLIGYHPKPRLRSIAVNGANVTLSWDGPSSMLRDFINGTTTSVHHYQVERSPTLAAQNFQPIGPVTTERTLTIQVPATMTAYYRVRLLP